MLAKGGVMSSTSQFVLDFEYKDNIAFFVSTAVGQRDVRISSAGDDRISSAGDVRISQAA